MPPLFVILARLPMSAPIHRHFSFAHGIPISRKLLDCPQTTQNYSALANGGNLASLTVPPTKAFSAPHASRRHFRHIHSCVIGSFSSTRLPVSEKFPSPSVVRTTFFVIRALYSARRMPSVLRKIWSCEHSNSTNKPHNTSKTTKPYERVRL